MMGDPEDGHDMDKTVELILSDDEEAEGESSGGGLFGGIITSSFLVLFSTF